MINKNIEEQHTVKRNIINFETEDVDKRDWELLHKYVDGLLPPTKWYDNAKSNAFGAFIAGLLSIIPYLILIFSEEKINRYQKFSENLPTLIITFLFCIFCFIIYIVCSKLNKEKEDIIYYSKSTVLELIKTMDKKNGFNMELDSNNRE